MLCMGYQAKKQEKITGNYRKTVDKQESLWYNESTIKRNKQRLKYYNDAMLECYKRLISLCDRRKSGYDSGTAGMTPVRAPYRRL